MESARRAGKGFRARHLRRLFGLATLGALHAVYLFEGDILVTYALAGLLLLAVRNWSPRRSLRVAVALLAVLAVLLALVGTVAAADPDAFRIDRTELLLEAENLEEARSGSPVEVVRTRVDELILVLPFVIFLQGPIVFALFLIGLAAGKLRLLHEPERFDRMWRRLLVVGLALGLPGGVLYAWGAVGPDVAEPAVPFFTLAADVLLAPCLTAAYVAAFVFLARSPAGGAVVRALAPAGRMALTNYIGQSFVLAFIFTGYGAALVGDVSPLVALLIALGVFAAQVPLSAWWMRHHLYGPLEWLLRAFTYRTIPPWGAAREGSEWD